MNTFSIILTIIACGDKSVDTASPSENTYEFQGKDFVFHSAEGFSLIGETIRLQFNADSPEMSFQAGCNSYGGTYSVEAGLFQISEMGSTLMACDNELMEQDDWLYSFFTSNPNVVYESDTITFTGSNATLVFQDEEIAIPDLSLQNVPWEIDSYIDGEIANAYNLQAIPNFMFASDGTFSMNTGCNGASGTYTDNNGTLSISIDVITDAICEGDINTVEGHIFQVFNGTPSYEIDAQRITLMSGNKGISAYASFE